MAKKATKEQKAKDDKKLAKIIGITPKLEPHGKAHDVRKGKCVVCARSGGELKLLCPGYKTAGDYIDWSQPLPVVKTKSTPVAKKAKKK